MRVPDDRRRLIHKPVSGEDDPHEHVQVLAAAGRCTSAEGFIKAADILQQRAGDCEVGASTEDASRVRIEGGIVSVLGEVKDSPLAYSSPSLTQVKVELRWVLELGGCNETGDTGHSGCRAKAAD